MGKAKELEKSDDIEIISIGNLYTGPWDKKYWSSSRGKDRYPYPVGYKSIRNQNEITYRMEIIQGPKGPSFTISSTDGKSCSGETPDIALENFQKKGCSRLKLGHGTRSSCKIDGVEFFGFKNAFVQRLLRELVVNVCGTAEQRLLMSSISRRDSDTLYQLNDKESVENHDLVPYLVNSLSTRKRSRNKKVVNNERVNQTQFKQNQHENNTQNASASNSRQTDKLACSGGDSTVIAAANELSRICSRPDILGQGKLATMIENKTALLNPERVAQLDYVEMPDYFMVQNPLCEGEKELSSSGNDEGIGSDKGLKNQEPNNGPRIADVQEFVNSMPEEKDRETNFQHAMRLVKDVDTYVPVTSDPVGDSFPAHSLIEQFSSNGKEEIVKYVAKSEVLITDSLPEEEIGISASNSTSEKFDTDSVGEDMAKSMMTVLLPRALPLLNTFTRKRRKNPHPRLQEENNLSNTCIDDASIARELTKHSNLERHKEKICVPRICNNSVFSPSENMDPMVPDSFDNDDSQDVLPDSVKGGYVPDTQKQLQVKKEANLPTCHGGIKENELNLHHEVLSHLSKTPEKAIRTTDVMLVATTDAVIAPQMKIGANSRRAMADCHTTDKLPAIQESEMKCTPGSESNTCRSLSDVDLPEVPDMDCCYSEIEAKEMKKLIIQKQLDRNVKLPGCLELFACHIHPLPISMVQLIVKENDIYICVNCSSLESKQSTLFVYKAVKKGKKRGCPFFIGYAPISFQLSRNALSGEIALECSLLQFTPNAEALVLLNSIKTPCCREGRLDCLCSACGSDYIEENAIKIVQLNHGYVSLVAKLETTKDVCCLLVCEPNILLAAEDGGKLKLWVMNSTWSAQRENWYLPTFNCMFPCLVELKKIPNSPNLVLGHNGFGEFGIWNIVERNLVSKFSSPGMSILKCVPCGIFKWQRELNRMTEEIIDEIMGATRLWFSETVRCENHVSPTADEDVVVWLLISNVDQNSQCYQSSAQHGKLPGYWKLALLINTTVIIGSAIDEGAAVVTSSGYGIIGSRDGVVYEWELSTGTKLGILHSFKGTPVSCIATDETNSGALAIASGCQLLVYLPS